MKIKFKLAFLALLLLTGNRQLSTLHAQGTLTPPGAPAAGMKSLAQIEPRTPISAAPFTITVSGSYYLTTNLTVSTGINVITVAANNVMLDLNGFTLFSTENPAASSIGISLNAVTNITIVHGFISGGVTNNGGIYGGSGFGYGIAYGIVYPTTQPANVRVSDVSVSGCRFYGIEPGRNNAVVESCMVYTAGSIGIFASNIKSCRAVGCGDTAIFGDQVSDCHGECAGSGNGLNATTALNCYGYSSSGSYGLYADIVQNCYGENNGSGVGLFAGKTATGSYGYSSFGTGLSAFIANSCNGSSLSVTHNLNSY